MMLLEEHARELSGHGPNWSFYALEAIRGPDRELIATKITGAVAPAITRGPRKGQPNWRKLDRSTREVLYVTPAAHSAWCLLWEARTGKCRECAGDGEVCTGWSVAEGRRTKICPRCGGSGLAEKPTKAKAS